MAGAGERDSSPRRSSLRRTISVPVTSTSRDTAPLAFHAKVHGASRAAVAGALPTEAVSLSTNLFSTCLHA